MEYLGVFLILILMIYGIQVFMKRKKKVKIIQPNDTKDERYNAQKVMKALTIDQILDKVSEKGIESLSKSEKAQLDEYSKQ